MPYASAAGAAIRRARALPPLFVIRYSLMEIHESARKHGVADADVLHAARNALATDDQDDNVRVYLGPGRNAELLEVAAIVRAEGPELAIHAMKMHPKYKRLLPGE
jgi:hypothetical protein